MLKFYGGVWGGAMKMIKRQENIIITLVCPDHGAGIDSEALGLALNY